VQRLVTAVKANAETLRGLIDQLGTQPVESIRAALPDLLEMQEAQMNLLASFTSSMCLTAPRWG
jgi:hypothetical protein